MTMRSHTNGSQPCCAHSTHLHRACQGWPCINKTYAAPSLATKRFKLLTHNVWCHIPMSYLKQPYHAMPGSRFQERLRLFARHCAAIKYDVVAVQELFLWKLWPLPVGRSNFDLLARYAGESFGWVHMYACGDFVVGRDGYALTGLNH